MGWGEVWDWAIRFFPRIETVDPNYAGVLLRAGKYRKTVNGDWYFLLPIVDEIHKIDTQPQIINLPNQSATTLDGICVATSSAIEYDIPIEGVHKTLLEVQDYDQSLQNLAMGLVTHYIVKHSFDQCRKLNGLESTVLKGLRKKSTEWGLNVKKFWVTDLVEHKAYRIMSDNYTNPVIQDE